MAGEPKNKKENNRHFFKDFKAELKKVIWPTPKQVANNTTAVITIVLITAIIVFALDVAFEKVNTHGIDRLRSVVKGNEIQNSIDNTVSDEHDHDDDITDNTILDNNITEQNTISE